MLTSAPFDDWWHNAYGLDVEILSPPHAVLALGMFGVTVGSLMLSAALQNRSEAAGSKVRGFGLVFAARPSAPLAHSVRNTDTGSTRAAASAGTTPAKHPTTSVSTVTVANTAESVGVTP